MVCRETDRQTDIHSAPFHLTRSVQRETSETTQRGVVSRERGCFEKKKEIPFREREVVARERERERERGRCERVQQREIVSRERGEREADRLRIDGDICKNLFLPYCEVCGEGVYIAD